KDYVEVPAGTSGEIAHIPLDRLQLEALAGGDEPIPLELLRGCVEYGDQCACSGQNRGLLAASGSKTKDPTTPDSVKPARRQRSGSEACVPSTSPGLRDCVRAYRLRPLTLLGGLTIPRVAIVSKIIELFFHQQT